MRNQLNASQPSDVLDHLGVERPTGTSRPYASEIGNWSPSSYQPFTPAWYAQHPNAWQITHPNADVAAVATATAVATWLGLSHAYTGSSTTTIVEDTSISDPSTTTPETAPEITEDTAVTIDNGEWMPLGSFELKLDGQSVATRAVHLAVNRQGLIRGNYYDMAADSVKEVTGKVDKQTLQTSWTIGEDGLVVYEISVPALSSPDGQLTVRYANGRTATWRTSPIQP